MTEFTTDKNADGTWTVRSETATSNKYFPAQAWIRIKKDGIVSESNAASGLFVPCAELRAYAAAQMAEMAKQGAATAYNTPTPSSVRKAYKRTTCLNCDLTTSILIGRGYCTDCYGEC